MQEKALSRIAPSPALSATALRSLLDQLSLAIFVFRGERLVYTNPPANRLVNRLRSKYAIELQIMLLDHLAQSRERLQTAEAAFTLTTQDNEPFAVNLMNLRGRHDDIAFSIREIGTVISAFGERYRLSRRESQVAELVLRGRLPWASRRRRRRSTCLEFSKRSASTRARCLSANWPEGTSSAGFPRGEAAAATGCKYYFSGITTTKVVGPTVHMVDSARARRRDRIRPD